MPKDRACRHARSPFFLLALALGPCSQAAFGQNAISTGTKAGFRMYYPNSNDWWLDPSSGRFDIRINGGAAKATMDSLGNLGIGTTSPAANLQVNNPAGDSTIRISVASTAQGHLEFAGPTAVRGAILANDGAQTGGVGALKFSAGGAGNDHLVILSNGSVGVGTASPTAKLNVSGNILATGDISGATINGGTPLMSPMASTLNINATPALATNQPGIQVSTNFFVMGGGNVGIGTTSPGGPLEVDGGVTPQVSARTTSSVQGGELRAVGSDATKMLSLISYGPSVTGNWFSSDARANSTILSTNYSAAGGNIQSMQIGTTEAAPLVFGTNSSERMRVDSSGNVGIGTTGPSYLLDARGSSQGSALHVGQAADTGLYLQYTTLPELGFDSYFNGTSFIAKESYAGRINANASGLQFFYDNGLTAGASYSPAAKLVLNNAGNMGIGTTNPSWPLTVYGTGPSIYALDNGANGTRAFMAATNSDVQFGNSYSNANVPIRFMAGGTHELMRIDSSGSVGIGTTAPSSKLTVQSPLANSYAAYFQGNGTNSQSFGLQIDAGTTASDFAFRVRHVLNATEYFAVRGDGNVGVGTTNPGAKLHIGGTAGADGIMFPDGTLQKTAAPSGIATGALPNFYVRYASGTLNGQTVVTIQNVMDAQGNPVIAANRPCDLHIAASAAVAVNYMGWWNGDNSSTHYGIYGYIIGPATENYQACSAVPLTFSGAGVSGFQVAANSKASMDITWDTYTSNTSLFGRRQADELFASGCGATCVGPFTGSYWWSGNGSAPTSFSFGTTTNNGSCGAPTNTAAMTGYWELYCSEAHQ